jgi:hypothetical protein
MSPSSLFVNKQHHHHHNVSYSKKLTMLDLQERSTNIVSFGSLGGVWRRLSEGRYQAGGIIANPEVTKFLAEQFVNLVFVWLLAFIFFLPLKRKHFRFLD